MTARAMLVLVAGLCLVRRADAQAPERNDPWMREVRSALAGAARRVPGGTPLREGLRVGMLAEGEEGTLPVVLEPGASYLVIAACDRDCGRLALQVVDPRRYELDADRSATRQPALQVTAAVGGIHRFEVEMTSCRVNPCRYGIVVLRVPSPRDSGATTRTGLISRHGRPYRTPRFLAGPPPDLRPGPRFTGRSGGA